MDQKLERIQIDIALLQQTDEHIKNGLEDIKSILKASFEEQKSMNKEYQDRIVKLEYASLEAQKKIDDIQSAVKKGKEDIQSFKDLKNKLIGYCAGAGVGGGGVVWGLFKALGLIH